MNHAFKTTTIAGAAAVGLMAVPSAGFAESLTIVSWGGAYEESQRRAYYEPYTEMTGTEIIQESRSAEGLAGVRAQVEAGNVQWDLVDMLEPDSMRGCDDGVLEVIDHDEILKPAPDGTPPSEDFVLPLRDCYIPQILYSTALAYNTRSFDGDAPSSVADVWDTDTYSGRRSLRRVPAANLEWALYADGVARDEVYDVLQTRDGPERAFAKLDEIKDDVLWWTEGAQPPQLLADREVAIASGYNGRLFNAQVVEDQPIEMIWDGQLLESDGWVVPQGKLTSEVRRFLRFATDTQRLADQAKYISYGPARASSAEMVGDHADLGIDMAPHMPTNPDHVEVGIFQDAEFWADMGDTLEERFSSWLAR